MSPKPLARQRADGGTTYQVKWRLGGTRAGAWASESFTDERAAKRFRLDVEDAAMQWSDGWLKGVGYATPPPPRLRDVAESYLGQQERRVRRGKVKPYTLQRDRRTAELHMATLLDQEFAAINDDDIADWIDDQLDAGVAPKSVRNRHGLLSSIVTHGAGRMKLRPDNPCALPLTEDELAAVAPSVHEHDAPTSLVLAVLGHPAISSGVVGRYANEPPPRSPPRRRRPPPTPRAVTPRADPGPRPR